jgi:hypothetical protein
LDSRTPAIAAVHSWRLTSPIESSVPFEPVITGEREVLGDRPIRLEVARLRREPGVVAAVGGRPSAN